MSAAGLTEPQQRLLERLRMHEGPMMVHGHRLRVARALEAKGFAVVTVNGVPFRASWWYEAEAVIG